MSRFIFYIDVTNILPSDIPAYMNKVKNSTESFFKKGEVLYIPKRKDDETVLFQINDDA